MLLNGYLVILKGIQPTTNSKLNLVGYLLTKTSNLVTNFEFDSG